MNLSSDELIKEFTEFLKEKRLGGRARYGARKLGEAVTANPRTAGLLSAAPAVSYGLGSLAQGQIAQGLGEIGGGVAGERLARGPAAAAQAAVSRMGVPGKLAAPLVGMGVRAAGGLLGGAVAGGLAQPVAALGEKAVDVVAGRQREEGKTPGLFGGTGVGDLSPSQISQLKELATVYGVDIPVEQTKALMPLANQMKDQDMQRTMQLNQQLGQLTGALNRQQYTFQLAQGAQSEAGANLRTMMTSNPYASSVFRG